jgi:hypothetical protein
VSTALFIVVFESESVARLAQEAGAAIALEANGAAAVSANVCVDGAMTVLATDRAVTTGNNVFSIRKLPIRRIRQI